MADTPKWPTERKVYLADGTGVYNSADIESLKELVVLLVRAQVAYEHKQFARRRETDDKYREAVDEHRRAIELAQSHPLFAAIRAAVEKETE